MKMRVVLGVFLFFCVQLVQLHARNKGLSNCGSSCYFNSSMQAMSHLADFNALIKNIPNKDVNIEIYNGLMARLPGEGYISPVFPVIKGKTLEDCYHYFAKKFFGGPVIIYPTQEGLKKEYDALVGSVGQASMPSFEQYLKDNNTPTTYYKQEDAAEFIGKMITLILEQDKSVALKNIVQVDVDSVLNKSAHENCSESLRTSHSSNDSFKLPIPARPETVTILDCLKEYFKYEEVEVRCDTCGKNITASKYFKISRAPKSLILSLNRFISFDGESQKNETPILFTDLLVLNSFFSYELLKKIKYQELKYELKAFIVHRGEYGHGHYWTYGRDDKNWYIYEDENVFAVSPENMDKIFTTGISQNFGGGAGEPTPYIFFYELDKQSEEILKMAEEQPIPNTEPKLEPVIKPAQDLLVQKLQALQSSVKNIGESIKGVQEKLEPLKNKLRSK